MKVKVCKQTKEAIKGAMSEIIAGSVLFPKSEEDKVWNNANLRAAVILKTYLKGEGLFQVTTSRKAKS